MKYGSIYLVVKDFDRSLDFYEKVLDMKVSTTNGKRFAIFNNEGLNLCLLNGYYDEQHPEQKETKGEPFPEYDDTSKIAANLTPIRYLNVFSPYWYFTFLDPDGNPIEITGKHDE